MSRIQAWMGQDLKKKHTEIKTTKHFQWKYKRIENIECVDNMHKCCIFGSDMLMKNGSRKLAMKLLLPGGRGAGGIIIWGGRVQKTFFLPGGRGAGVIFSWGGRVQNHFSDLTFFLKFNLKIL